MGGYDDGNELATVEVYSPKTNSWRSCTPMSQRRFGPVAGVVGGRLVVAGGICAGQILTSVEAYTGTGWTPLPPMPHDAPWCHGVRAERAALCDRRAQAARLQVLETPEENGLSWSCKADLPAVRFNAASVVYEGRIWVMGGYVADEGPTASVITYDGETDTWGTAPPLPERTTCCRATTTSDGTLLLRSGPQSRRISRPRIQQRGMVRGGQAPRSPEHWNRTVGSVLLGRNSVSVGQPRIFSAPSTAPPALPHHHSAPSRVLAACRPSSARGASGLLGARRAAAARRAPRPRAPALRFALGAGAPPGRTYVRAGMKFPSAAARASAARASRSSSTSPRSRSSMSPTPPGSACSAGRAIGRLRGAAMRLLRYVAISSWSSAAVSSPSTATTTSPGATQWPRFAP